MPIIVSLVDKIAIKLNKNIKWSGTELHKSYEKQTKLVIQTFSLSTKFYHVVRFNTCLLIVSLADKMAVKLI